MAKSIDNSEDILDSRDIQERIDELFEVEESELEDYELEELNNLVRIKDEIGDDQNWKFGIVFIRDSYFEEDSEEFAYDCGGVDRDGSMIQYIDWERFAEDRKIYFQSIDFDGETYWYNL
jgi:hypothetical protein